MRNPSFGHRFLGAQLYEWQCLQLQTVLHAEYVITDIAHIVCSYGLYTTKQE